MKALHHNAYGPPRKVVTLVDLPEPVAGPGEVVVQVEAAAMHLADLKFINGDPGFRWFTFPRVCGHEGIGRVVAAASDVKTLKIGDRVLLPMGAGTFRQRLAVKASECVGAPEGDARQLSLTTVNGMTAVILLEDYAGHLKPGDWLLQNGANSSCGRFIIRLAKERGLRTCNIVRRESLVAELKAAGADAVVVDAGDPDATAAKIKAAVGGADLSIAFDCVAATGTETLARALAKDGIVVNYGFMTGKNCEMSFQDLFLRKIKLVGMNMANPRTEDQRRAIYAKLAGMLARGELSAKIAATYTLDQAQDAFAHQARTGDERQGKIIILPNG
ncbi:MAG: zinc-dependent alcohol dehydrogenase family protein [Alphaproteobacteria bacterium]|nr:zinc-dependent alcohol dehydrogenase family protein [Alphaproteobacteria bacterium]